MTINIMNLYALSGLLPSWLKVSKQAGNSQKPDSHDGEVYTTIRELPLRNFIRLVVDEEQTAVIKSGSPTWRAIKEAAQNLRQEFSIEFGTADRDVSSSMVREIVGVNQGPHLETIHEVIEATHSDPAALKEMLKIDGPAWINKGIFMHRKFDEADPAMFHRDIHAAYERLDTIRQLLATLKTWRKAIRSRDTKGFTNEYFESLLSIVFAFSIEKTRYDMTTYQFCQAVKAFVDYQKTLDTILYTSEASK